MNFTIKGQSREHMAVGLYRCSRRPVWEFVNPIRDRECAKFVLVDEKDMPARLAFEERQGSK